MDELVFRPMAKTDWQAVSEIYLQGIKTGNATFQQEVPEWKQWDYEHLKECRFVALIKNEIAGWVALTPVSERCAFAGVAELSLYIAEKFRGMHLGQKLLKKLIEESEKENIWTLQAGIFPENHVSIKVHEKSGFRIVGYRERIGKMNGSWRDIVLMERRSNNIGMDD